MHALVTGGAGFIGSHLCDALASAGHTVTVLDDLSTGHLENLASCPHRFIKGDVSQFDDVLEAVRGVDCVFHLAAIASVPKTVADPRRSQAVNLGGTFNVLEACRAQGVKRVVLASSAAVYGMGTGKPEFESDLPAPASPYALEKLSSEYYLQIYASLYGLETVALRFFNVFGPRQDPSSPYSGVISLFCKHLSQKMPVTIYGDGEQSRDFVSVFDVVRALILASQLSDPKGTVCNVARGESVTINTLYRELAALYHCDLKPQYAPAREGDHRLSVASVEKAETVLGFKAALSLKEGLLRLVQG